jgi:hypothetical protein
MHQFGVWVIVGPFQAAVSLTGMAGGGREKEGVVWQDKRPPGVS